MGMSISKPYRFIILSDDIEEVKKMREYNNQVIPDKSTAIAVDTNEQFIFQDGKWRKMTIKMTIDEALKILDNISTIGEQVDALEMAIETMRKYQKIQDIVEQWACCGNPSDSMIAISEVLENGNDD